MLLLASEHFNGSFLSRVKTKVHTVAYQVLQSLAPNTFEYLLSLLFAYHVQLHWLPWSSVK